MSEQQFEAPFEVISPDNQGAKVIVTGFVLLITTIFVAIIRLITMCVLKRRSGWDDVFFLVATSNYASEILFIMAIATAKTSIGLLIRRLTPQTKFRLITDAIIIAVAAWTVFSVLALALQCGIHRPWIFLPRRCTGDSPHFNSLTKLEEAESDSTKGLTPDGVLCTTDIRVDVEQGEPNTHAIVEEVAISNDKDFYHLA
ncbi:MAG: hypothetical protein Q9187_002493 [Circinaria calcarea]